MDVYLPREDSYLLQKQIRKFVKPDFSVLDMGTGSGIQAIEAARYCKKVLAVDINSEALVLAKKNADSAKLFNITFVQSDLFKNIGSDKNFDLILFNPPYLPDPEEESDNEAVKSRHLALDGGKTGVELIAKFLSEAKFHLKKDGQNPGRILMIYSSLTKGFDDVVKREGFSVRVLDEQSFFMERIYAALLSRK